MTETMTSKTHDIICTVKELEAIPDPASKCLRDRIDNEPGLFVVKKNGLVFFYENSCPHLGIDLEWNKDQFLDVDDALIQCSTHGALFVIETGACVAGPCLGQKLTAIEHEIIDGQLIRLKRAD
jgi:nitrite reductase/ring-hydroxylating ferredoxin subunit